MPRSAPFLAMALALATFPILSSFPARAEPDTTGKNGWKAGEAAYLRGDWTDAYRLLKPLAKAGDARAETRIGDLLWAGYGVARNRPEAIRWYRKAAALSVPLALARLGVFQITGTAMPRDVDAGIGKLRRAASLGSGYAAEQLGLLFWQGALVVRDPARAIPMLRQAAAKKRPLSEHLLATAYAEGRGVPRNRFAAAVWAIRATTDAGPAQRQAYAVLRDQALSRLPADDVARARSVAAKRGDQVAVAYSAPVPPPPLLPASSRKVVLATGFFVTDHGVVLTDFHGTNNCRALRVTPSGDAAATVATIIASDPVNDLALLKTSLTDTPAARFRKGRPIRPGDGVVVLGYPLPNVLARQVNVTIGNISAMAGEHGDTRYLQMTAPIEIGDSGGPLLDMNGSVIGVVARKLNAEEIQKLYGDMPQNVNFATRARYARQFLSENSITYRTALSNTPKSPADIAESVSKSVVLVECDQ